MTRAAALTGGGSGRFGAATARLGRSRGGGSGFGFACAFGGVFLEAEARGVGLVQALNLADLGFVADQHLDADGRDLVRRDHVGARRIGRRHALRLRDRIDVPVVGQRLARVVLVGDLDAHLVLADTDAVAREQALRIAAADGLLGVVDVDAVRRRVDDVIAARAEVDARVAARQIALAVGKHPVALERAADRAAVVPELHRASFAEALAMTTDDLQA